MCRRCVGGSCTRRSTRYSRGDLHNLFGRVNEAHLFLDPDEPCGYYIEETIPGSTIGQILEDVQYFEQDLARMMKAQVDQAVKEDRVKPSEGMRLLDEYEAGLKEYTYLECSRGGGGEAPDAEARGS